MSISQRSEKVDSFKVMDVLQRANELQAAGHHVLHCEVGQPQTGAPPPVAQAAIDALQQNLTMGYTDAFGLLELRAKIRDFYRSHYLLSEEQTPSIDRIVVTTGSSAGFLLAFTACFDPGDAVAIASSGYPCYRNILMAVGCERAVVPINEHYKLTAKELAEEIHRRSLLSLKPLKGLILSSPSNPTGAMLTPHELEELCQLCDQHGIWFLSDEIYHGITYGIVAEATALQYSSKNSLVINSFSKYYSMSGWRLGWMILPDRLINPVLKLKQNYYINAPTISQVAALRCWDEETLEILESQVKKYSQSRTRILDELKELDGLDHDRIAPADGGFYVYVDLTTNTAPTLGSVAFCESLLEEKHVAFTPGVDFEDPDSDVGNQRFRISYAGGPETVADALDRLKEFWPTWRARVAQAQASLEQKNVE